MKTIWKYSIPLILFSVAWILKLYLSPLLIGSAIIIFLVKFRFASLETYLTNLAIVIDVFGNAMGAPLFNLLFTKPGGHLFGDRLETISYALAVNQEKGTLTKAGKAIGAVLNFFDSNHLNKQLKTTKSI